MKKFLASALMALLLVGFGALTEASQSEYDNACCRGNYYCAQDCDDNYSGEYCGRYGCGQGYNRGGR